MPSGRSLEGFQQTDCEQSPSFPRVKEVPGNQFLDHAIEWQAVKL